MVLGSWCLVLGALRTKHQALSTRHQPPMSDILHDWTTERVEALYHLPLTELLFRAQTVHRRYHDPETVQRCTLLSIKTGGCPEDCAYCPQSARYDTGVAREEVMKPDAVLAA